VAVRLYRLPITGWKKCVHVAAAFESRGEYATALLLDGSREIMWWLRNDPAIVRIPTPVGFFEPDFVYMEKSNGVLIQGLLEVKGDVFWDGAGSDARVKAAAAVEWVRAVNQASHEISWDFAVVLDEDAIRSKSIEALLRVPLVSSGAESS
jgi:hypothetical protein